MATPLYNGAQPPNTCPLGANSGLWYDKFCNQWNGDFDDFIDAGKKESGKNRWITQMARSTVGDETLLNEFHERRRQMLGVDNSKDRILLAETITPFVTGLGRSHPVENGFSWHHTLGVPYLAGSSVKGCGRAWAEEHIGEPFGNGLEIISKDDIKRIFGPKREKEKQVGSVIFLDALPPKPVKLKTEIMTPHYGPWYQNKEVPGDWHNPTPISFLAVAERQQFSFAVMPQDMSDNQSIKDCVIAMAWLKRTLEENGAGAKTSVMGWFEVVVERA